MKRHYEFVLAFLSRHERPIATFLFITGFIGDLLTFGLLNLSAVTVLFIFYLAFVLIATIIAHATSDRKNNAVVRSVSVLAPLLAQFTFGSLLSGFLIFYTKSAVLGISWPFIILLAIIFFGNEVFRNYRDQLIFQTILVYFCLYSFAIFALPLYLHKLGPTIFIESTLATVVVFGVYLAVLRQFGKSRLRQVLPYVIGSTLIITILIVFAYFEGLLPPIPLTLKEGGIYHSISHTGSTYAVTKEITKPWWDIRPVHVHHVPGTPVYAYSAIFAPGAFSTRVVHVWQQHDDRTGSWKTMSTIPFSLSGGRSGGYRGYSYKNDITPGTWRVLVKTQSGQTIGEFKFVVENATVEPSLVEENL